MGVLTTYPPPAVNLWQDQDLSYGEIFAGQPAAWLLKIKSCYACNHKISKRPYIENQNNFQNMFHFYDSFNGLLVRSLY